MMMETKILEWLASGDTGISSEAMAFTAAGIKPKRLYPPSDPADFNRCLLLLRDVPEIKEKFGAIASISERWAELIARWSELEDSFINEAGLNWCKARKAPKTYQLMKDIGL